ncbi:unnamed protein product [Fusarium venenatum]|uniref:Fucose-specific lectin n=1 Tax=Fusarium venenatum TaxID=56646 RepID=A0A2L2SUU3_9HYPO|nr:uncharacterized protein FVRRES_04634 [Fusarium venenatum]CEI60198.1 unnamed protein product [Fusarium venenatum]
MPRSLLVLLLSFACLLIEPVVGLAAWWTLSPDGFTTPHFAYQDPKSGDILHSSCNSNTSAAFSPDKANIFPIKENIAFKSQPKFSTPLAVTGWWDNDLNTPIASVFYQGIDNSIMNALFKCDNKTGNYTFDAQSDNVVSELAGTPSVYKETELAIVKVGGSGFRLHYHDEGRLVNLLSSKNGTDWQYSGPVSRYRSRGTAMAAVYTGSTNSSIVWAHTEVNLNVARFNNDSKDKWSIKQFPEAFHESTVTNNSDPKTDFFIGKTGPPLLYLTGNFANLSLTANSNNELSLFYIGEDTSLHEYLGADDGWKKQTHPGARIWPEADHEFGRLATASPPDSDEMWVYYTGKSDVVELHKDKRGIWSNAKMPSLTTATNVKYTPPDTDRSPREKETETATDEKSAKPSSGPGLATGVQVGIGVGVGIGVIALVVAMWFFLKNRRRTTVPAEGHQPPELQDTGKSELSDTAKFELPDTAKHELSDTSRF